MKEQIELAELDLTSDEVRVVYVVAWNEEGYGGYEWRDSERQAAELTHADLDLPEHVQLYRFKVTMEFRDGADVTNKLSDYYEDHIGDHKRALAVAQQGD